MYSLNWFEWSAKLEKVSETCVVLTKLHRRKLFTAVLPGFKNKHLAGVHIVIRHSNSATCAAGRSWQAYSVETYIFSSRHWAAKYQSRTNKTEDLWATHSRGQDLGERKGRRICYCETIRVLFGLHYLRPCNMHAMYTWMASKVLVSMK
jgi:hypothetical protein